MADLNAFEKIHDEKKIDTSRKIKYAIIGTGWIAEHHTQWIAWEMPDVEIVAMADLVPGKAKAFAERYGLGHINFYNSGEELLANEKDLDAVSICTYNTQHAPCAIQALKAGVNVMVEKPFTVTLDEAVAIAKAEKESGKIVNVGFQPRMSVNYQAIKKIVESGELGKIYYIQTGGGRRRGIPTPFGTSFIAKDTGAIGAIGDIGCYSLDLVLNAIGYPKPLTATGYTTCKFGKDPENYPGHPEYADAFEVDDFAAGFVRLEGDIILDFRIAWAMNIDTPGDTIILGDKGGLRIPSTGCWNGECDDRPMIVYKQVGGKQIQYEIPFTKGDGINEMFKKKMRSFIDAVKEGKPAPVPSWQGVYNQAIIDALIKSSKLGEEVKIEIPEI